MRKIAMAIGATLAITYVVAFSIYKGEAGRDRRGGHLLPARGHGDGEVAWDS